MPDPLLSSGTGHWPKIQILHPYQGAQPKVGYVPYSSKIVGWCLSTAGIARIDLLYLGRVTGAIVHWERCDHPSAIAQGGGHYHPNCGFSVIPDFDLPGTLGELVTFQLRAVDRSGRTAVCDAVFSVDRSNYRRQMGLIASRRETDAMQRLAVCLLTKNPGLGMHYVVHGLAQDDHAGMTVKSIDALPPLLPRKVSRAEEIDSNSDLPLPTLIEQNQPGGEIELECHVRDGTAIDRRAELELILLCFRKAPSLKYVRGRVALEGSRHGHDFGFAYFHTFGPLLDRARITRVLVIKVDRIGDVVSAFPAIKRLRTILPNATLTLVVTSYTHGVAVALGLANDIITPQEVAGRQWDVALDLRVDEDARQTLWIADAHLKLLFGQSAADQRVITMPGLLPTPQEPGRAQNRHIAEQLQSLVDALDIHLGGGSPSQSPSGAKALETNEALPLALRGTKYFVVNVGPDNDVRCWPVSRFAELSQRFHALTNLSIGIIGSDGERARCLELKRILAESGISAIDLIGDRDARELVAVIANASFFIGIDSGPKHLAMLLDIPGVIVHGGRHSPIVWGSTNPKMGDVYSPVICSPCLLTHASECPNGLVCLDNISVSAVFARAALMFDLFAKEGIDTRDRLDLTLLSLQTNRDF